MAPTVGTTRAGITDSAASIYINNRQSVDSGGTRSNSGPSHSRRLRHLHQAHGKNVENFERATRNSISTRTLTRSLQDRKTSALQTLPMVTRHSSRGSLRWKDAELSWPQPVKISANSNGWISLDNSRTEALSESDGTPHDFGKIIPDVGSDINSKIPPVKTCGIQSRTTTQKIEQIPTVRSPSATRTLQ